MTLLFEVSGTHNDDLYVAHAKTKEEAEELKLDFEDDGYENVKIQQVWL